MRKLTTMAGALLVVAAAMAGEGARAAEGVAGSVVAARPAATQAVAPVPLLSPEDEAKTFNLPAGYRAEVVACEPMVEHPVAIAFDARGRLWVAEMRGYMPDVDGWRETAPVGRVSCLEDTDGDGRMDKATVFVDKLVLPRAIGFAGDGVLVGSPPKLLWARDTDGDGKADEVKEIASDFGVPENPENGANGLMWGLDNWNYSAMWGKRLKYLGGGKFDFSPVPQLGQYGISRDDWGRTFFNTNSDYLRGAMVGMHYAARNPGAAVTLANMRVAIDQTCWPAHASTENRGYREGFLRADGTLKEFTAACSPCVYRGELMPELYGNVFVAEATANLVRRAVLSEKDGVLSAKNAYDGREFIASTYERFRPVWFETGPEGALYVCDMHHGLIQHKMSLTDYAKKEYKEKSLDKHLKTGRIFRVVPDRDGGGTHGLASAATMPASESTAQLVGDLKAVNGWRRGWAQRLLVDRKDEAAVAGLREMTRADKPVERATALWTLEGMGKVDADLVKGAMGDGEAKVRAIGVRLAEPFLEKGELVADVMKLRADPAAEVREQWVLSVGGVKSAACEAAVVEMLNERGGETNVREAAVSGLSGREITVLSTLLADDGWGEKSAGRAAVMTDLARAVTRRDDVGETKALVEVLRRVTAGREWQQVAVMDAFPAVRRDAFGGARLIQVDAEPEVVKRLTGSNVTAVKVRAEKVGALFTWPGKPAPPRPVVKPLTEKQKKLFEVGRQQFATVCVQCHGTDAKGMEGKGPPLAGSAWTQGPEGRVIRIVLNGLRGPITVGEQVYTPPIEMPSLKAMTDEQIAGVLTFVRRSFGNEASAVEPAAVWNIRDWGQARKDAWTEGELLKVK